MMTLAEAIRACIAHSAASPAMKLGGRDGGSDGEAFPAMPPGFAAWISHLLELDALRAAGCTFGPDDLTANEWQGLKLLTLEREKFWEAHWRCSCGRVLARGLKCLACETAQAGRSLGRAS